MIVAELCDSGEEESVLAGMELKNVVVLHRSQLAYEVKIVIQDRIWDGEVTWCVEGIA